MYTILVNNDNELITSVRERIMQRSKLVDSLHFLVNQIYKDIEMKDFTVRMDYRLPVSEEPHSEILDLTVDEENNPILYKDHLEYKLPIDSNLTREAGDIEVKLTFTKTELDADGQATQRVRKTSSAFITIVKIEAWCIPSDSALDAVDQRQLKADEQIKALSEIGELMVATKADNIQMNDNYLQLTSNGEPIGDKVEVKNIVEVGNDELVKEDSDGIFRVVEF